MVAQQIHQLLYFFYKTLVKTLKAIAWHVALNDHKIYLDQAGARCLNYNRNMCARHSYSVFRQAGQTWHMTPIKVTSAKHAQIHNKRASSNPVGVYLNPWPSPDGDRKIVEVVEVVLRQKLLPWVFSWKVGIRNQDFSLQYHFLFRSTSMALYAMPLAGDGIRIVVSSETQYRGWFGARIRRVRKSIELNIRILILLI